MLHVPFLLQATLDILPRVALRDDLAEAAIGEVGGTPQAETSPTTVHCRIGDGVQKFYERPAKPLLTIESDADAIMGEGNTRCVKHMTLRWKAKPQEGPRV